MAKQATSPMGAFDFTKLMDVSKFDFGEFTKFAEQFKLPGLDGNALLDAQRKNIEAITSANRIAVEGIQAVAQRQTEILRQTVEESSKAMRDLVEAGTPQEKLTKQTELIKEAFDVALSNMRELAEMSAKSNSDAVGVLNKRFNESLEEVKSLIKQAAEIKAA